MNERIKTIGNPFMGALLSYIEANLITPIKEINYKYKSNSCYDLYENSLEKA